MSSWIPDLEKEAPSQLKVLFVNLQYQYYSMTLSFPSLQENTFRFLVTRLIRLVWFRCSLSLELSSLLLSSQSILGIQASLKARKNEWLKFLLNSWKHIFFCRLLSFFRFAKSDCWRWDALILMLSNPFTLQILLNIYMKLLANEIMIKLP